MVSGALCGPIRGLCVEENQVVVEMEKRSRDRLTSFLLLYGSPR